MLFIDLENCTGCAACVEACPTGAIRLNGDGGVATIDAALCDECLICVEVCPNGAIQRFESAALTPVEEAEADVVEGEIVKETVSPTPRVQSPARARPPGRVAVLAGAALSYLGNRLLPRLADALVGAVERRLTSGPEAKISDTSRPVGGRMIERQNARKGRRGHRRRRRHRGG